MGEVKQATHVRVEVPKKYRKWQGFFPGEPPTDAEVVAAYVGSLKELIESGEVVVTRESLAPLCKTKAHP